MGLLVSPIDGSPMRQVNRYGIEIDVCPTTGGVWLDKGELEKMIALLKEESQDYSTERPKQREYRRDYNDDDRYDSDYRYKHKSKKSKLMDIFDF